MKNNFKFLISLALLSTATANLSGCIPVIGAAATTTGVWTAQERTVGSAIDDKTIWTAIKDVYFRSPDNQILSGVNVEVIQGRVLLSGSVDHEESMLKAVELAWKAKGVKEVINEIQIRQKSFGNFALDSWVTTQVKSKLLVNEHVRSVNYHVETVNGIVYLFGIAKTQKELDVAAKIASTVPNVKKVVSHIQVEHNGNQSSHSNGSHSRD